MVDITIDAIERQLNHYHKMLARYGYAGSHRKSSPSSLQKDDVSRYVGTLFSNLAYYGYVPSRELIDNLLSLDLNTLTVWWINLDKALSSLTADNRKMDAAVVYKNFPMEVLNKSAAQYWFAQILMYYGFPNDWFTEDEVNREPMEAIHNLKVLHPESLDTVGNIYARLVSSPYKWNNDQSDDAAAIFRDLHLNKLDVSEFGHRGNAISLAKSLFPNLSLKGYSATDVLRLAANVSFEETNCDVSLRTPPKFKRFSRQERKVFVTLLERCGNLDEDFSMRPEVWKRFLSFIHPGDYKAPHLQEAYNKLYRGDLKPNHNALVEDLLSNGDITVLSALESRPGDFMRRLHHCYSLFDREAFERFVGVLPELTTMQLLKTKGYLRTINERPVLLTAPRGVWGKVNKIENNKAKIIDADLDFILQAIDRMIADRLNHQFPEGFSVDPEVSRIRIQASDQELAPYGRGTEFAIPDDVKFIRTASYWQCKESRGNIWFDNGIMFFDENWELANENSTVSWDIPNMMKPAVLFSGDPTIAKSPTGAGCQMIDINLDEIAQQFPNVRYALWSILCYSNKPFSKADDVVATLQWGDNPSSGELYEPSRAQMIFPIKGENLTRYVAYIDVKERKLVYMDLPLPSLIQSASSEKNIKTMEGMMPHVQSMLAAQPTMMDLFGVGKKGDIPVLLTDHEHPVSGKAYVFRLENTESNFENLDVDKILNQKGGSPHTLSNDYQQETPTL